MPLRCANIQRRGNRIEAGYIMSVRNPRQKANRTISEIDPIIIYSSEKDKSAAWLDRVNVICPACQKERTVSKQSIRICGHSYCRRCSRVKDRAGERYDHLTAVRFTGRFQGARSLWEFVCDCGNPYIGVIGNAKYGTVKACGCLNHRSGKDHPLFIDITGQRYGRLVVVEYSHSNGRGAIWKCLCDCGNQFLAASEDIRSSGTQSCGCWFLESRTGENNPNWNPDLTQAEREYLRSFPEYRRWLSFVYERDDYTCQACQSKSIGNIVAHHLHDYSTNPELRTEAGNGVTLCEQCHYDFHVNYMGGWIKPCTSDDFRAWLESKEAIGG